MRFEFPMRGESKHLTEKTRANLPGSFIHLQDGVVHYELAGPDDAPVVVLVHGFSVPYFIWDPTFEALAAGGYRVLRYDLFGRGYSDRPFGRYNTELFDRQLTGLLDGLGIERCRAIFGLSMGGVIAANFAVKNPEWLEKLVLVDPAGFQLDYPAAYKILLVPVIGDVLFSLMGEETLKKSMSEDFYDPAHVDMFLDQYKPQMAFRGFKRAILSTIREGITENGLEIYRQLGQMDAPPVLLVWGEEDQTVPFKYSKVLVSLVPRIKFHPIESSGHLPHYEEAEKVTPIFLEFLDGG